MNQDDFEKKLSSFDFSGDSRARRPLRARLLSKRESRTGLAPIALAFAAAAALLLLPSRAPRAPAFPVGPHGFPVMPGTLPARAGAKTEPVFQTRPVTLDDIFENRKLPDHI